MEKQTIKMVANGYKTENKPKEEKPKEETKGD